MMCLYVTPSLISALASHNKEIFCDSADVEGAFFNNIPDMLKTSTIRLIYLPWTWSQVIPKKREYMVSW